MKKKRKRAHIYYSLSHKSNIVQINSTINKFNACKYPFPKCPIQGVTGWKSPISQIACWRRFEKLGTFNPWHPGQGILEKDACKPNATSNILLCMKDDKGLTN